MIDRGEPAGYEREMELKEQITSIFIAVIGLGMALSVLTIKIPGENGSKQFVFKTVMIGLILGILSLFFYGHQDVVMTYKNRIIQRGLSYITVTLVAVGCYDLISHLINL